VTTGPSLPPGKPRYIGVVASSAEDDYRKRLYDAYVSTHTGIGAGAAMALVYRRDIRPNLPADRATRILDIGCGQGELVRQLALDGYVNAAGVDISPEQVAAAHAAGNASVEVGDLLEVLERRIGDCEVVLALDLVEHLTKKEVFRTFDRVFGALSPGGLFIARVPNAVSPFGGNYRYGDFTHETSFTARSLTQLSGATGFQEVCIVASRPVVHGVKSGLRSLVWRGFEGMYKLSLASETGQLKGHIVSQNIVMVARKATHV